MNKIKALIEGIIGDLVGFIAEDSGVTIEQAMDIVYNSELFDKLTDCETELYRESSAYVYSILKDEIKYGKIVAFKI
jgi:hypothetical protein